MTYKDIAKDLRTGLMPPGKIAEYKLTLSGEYCYYSDELTRLMIEHNEWFSDHRAEYKSDTACDREWGRTIGGQREIILKQDLKAIEKLISACSTFARIKDAEARSQY